MNQCSWRRPEAAVHLQFPFCQEKRELGESPRKGMQKSPGGVGEVSESLLLHFGFVCLFVFPHSGEKLLTGWDPQKPNSLEKSWGMAHFLLSLHLLQRKKFNESSPGSLFTYTLKPTIWGIFATGYFQKWTPRIWIRNLNCEFMQVRYIVGCYRANKVEDNSMWMPKTL